MKIYAILDTVKGEYSLPFPATNHAEAGRLYWNTLKQHPKAVQEDLKLYHLGSYNPETGEISTLPEPMLLEGFEMIYTERETGGIRI